MNTDTYEFLPGPQPPPELLKKNHLALLNVLICDYTFLAHKVSQFEGFSQALLYLYRFTAHLGICNYLEDTYRVYIYRMPWVKAHIPNNQQAYWTTTPSCSFSIDQIIQGINKRLEILNQEKSTLKP